MNPRRRRVNRLHRKERLAELRQRGITLHMSAPSAEMRRDRLLPDISFTVTVPCLKA